MLYPVYSITRFMLVIIVCIQHVDLEEGNLLYTRVYTKLNVTITMVM